MWKKSMNNDKFKERQFVLDKDQLFYYKNEKQSKTLSPKKFRGQEFRIDYAWKCNHLDAAVRDIQGSKALP